VAVGSTQRIQAWCRARGGVRNDAVATEIDNSGSPTQYIAVHRNYGGQVYCLSFNIHDVSGAGSIPATMNLFGTLKASSKTAMSKITKMK